MASLAAHSLVGNEKFKCRFSHHEQVRDAVSFYFTVFVTNDNRDFFFFF